MSRSKAEALILIPARNEAETISSVVAGVRRNFANVLVVNDASTDETSQLAKAAGASVIDLPEHSGYSQAILVGLRYAAQNEFSQVAIIDGDGQHDFSDLPGLLSAHLRSGSHLTIGNRFSAESAKYLPPTKRWSNFLASCLANVAFGSALNDVACGLRVLEISLIRLLLTDPNMRGYAFACASIAVACRNRMRIHSFPVSVRYDASELQFTRQEEIISFVDVVIQEPNEEPAISKLLDEFKMAISAFEPVTILLGSVQLYLHPIHSEAGYIFQAQNRAFISSRTAGNIFDFNAISKKEGQKDYLFEGFSTLVLSYGL